MKEAKHTKLPWVTYVSDEKGWGGWYGVSAPCKNVNKKGFAQPDLSIAMLLYGGGAMRRDIPSWGKQALKENRAMARANARFIVRACNAHYDLLNAAKDVIEDIEDGTALLISHPSIQALLNAITKAEKG